MATTVPSIAGTSAARSVEARASAGARHEARGAASMPGLSLAFGRTNWKELSVPIGVLGILMAMITPLPSFLLDILISSNITLSVVVLLVAMHILKPVDFSIFPTTLLLLTLFRLALNVSSSRLILLNGNAGT